MVFDRNKGRVGKRFKSDRRPSRDFERRKGSKDFQRRRDRRDRD